VSDEDERRKVLEKLWRAAQPGEGTKSTRKSAKRALYVLKSGGVDVDSYRPERKTDTGGGKSSHALDSALLSVPDGLGYSQLIIVLLDEKRSSLNLFRFLIHTLYGVLQFSQSGGSRKQLQGLQDEEDLFFPVPPDYALYRLNKALERTKREDVSGLSRSLPALLEEMPDGSMTHPVRALVGSHVSRISQPGEDRKLFSLREIAGMKLPDEDVEDFRKQIAEARSSRLVLQNKTPEERIKELVGRFFRNYFNHERREDISTRLLDTAMAYYRRGMVSYAGMLIDYADRQLGPNPEPEQHPVLDYLVYRVLMNR
jgi:hypothetical protein